MRDARRDLQRAAADGVAPPGRIAAGDSEAALRALLRLVAATMLPRRLELSRSDGRTLVLEAAAGRLCTLNGGPPLDAADPEAPAAVGPTLRAFCTPPGEFAIARTAMSAPTRPGLDPAGLAAALDLPGAPVSEGGIAPVADLLATARAALPETTLCAALIDAEEAEILRGEAADFDALWALAETCAPGFLADPAALQALAGEDGTLVLGDAPAVLLRPVGAALLVASVPAACDVRLRAGQPD